MKEYDIKVGIHNHPKREKDPNYKHWDPNWVLDQVKALEKELAAAKGKLASAQGDELLSQAVDVKGLKVLAARLEGADAKTLRETLDKLKDKLKTAAIVLAAVDGGKVQIAAGVTADSIGKVKAGELVVLESLPKLETPSTKAVRAVVDAVASAKSRLVVMAGPHDTFRLSARNLPDVRVITTESLNTYDLMRHGRVVITLEAARQI